MGALAEIRGRLAAISAPRVGGPDGFLARATAKQGWEKHATEDMALLLTVVEAAAGVIEANNGLGQSHTTVTEQNAAAWAWDDAWDKMVERVAALTKGKDA